MAKLFGFSIEDTEKKSKSIVSPVPQNNEDGVDNYISSGFYGSYVDIEGQYRTEFDLIKRYREMSLHPECDNAIEDVVNEALVSDLYDSPIEIELSNLNATDKLKKAIRQEFKYLKELLDFDKKSHEIFRNWYVDGRLYYHKVIDLKNPQEGIKELRYIDPMKMRFIRQEKKKDKNSIGPNVPGKKQESAIAPEIDRVLALYWNLLYKERMTNNRALTSIVILKASIIGFLATYLALASSVNCPIFERLALNVDVIFPIQISLLSFHGLVTILSSA